MMSLGEWVTVLTITGVASGVCLFAVIYLIRQVMKQSAEAAISKKMAEDNAVTVEKMQEVTEIIFRDNDVSDTIDRLRGGKF